MDNTQPTVDLNFYPRYPRLRRTIPVKCGCGIQGNGTYLIPDPSCSICKGSGIKNIIEEEY